MIERDVPSLTLHQKTGLGTLVAIGIGAFAVGMSGAPERAWASLLVSNFFFLQIALGAVALLAVLYVSGAGWSSVLRRVPEAIAAWLPYAAAGMLALLLDLGSVYHWASAEAAHDEVLHAKHAYLNPQFFAARMLFVLAVWLAFAFALRRNSVREDVEGGTRRLRRNVVLSAVFLVVCALTFSMASFDWIMSLEPHWTSTIFGFYNLAGLLLAAVASTTVVVVVLRRRGLLPEVTEGHIADLGKLCFGLSTFWAYLWFSQYMLIWYANIPEEAAYYVARSRGGWSFLFWANLVLGWGVPFLTLLPRRAKRSEAQVYRMALLLLGARWLDVYLMVAPASSPAHLGIGVVDVAVLAGMTAAFTMVVASALRRAPIVPRADPYLVEGLHHEA